MGSPRPPPEKKGREAAASPGWGRFRRERRAGAAIFGQTEVVHSTKMLPLLHFRPGRRISWSRGGKRRKGKCDTPKGKGKKSELALLDYAISPAAFRAP